MVEASCRKLTAAVGTLARSVAFVEHAAATVAFLGGALRVHFAHLALAFAAAPDERLVRFVGADSVIAVHSLAFVVHGALGAHGLGTFGTRAAGAALAADARTRPALTILLATVAIRLLTAAGGERNGQHEGQNEESEQLHFRLWGVDG